ncbi:hypothetical protein CU100_14535 [Phyllobacterium endophyticum]|uniref:Uncharacterized protein n=1 Tax=Phyllobacterium endophyticum TaxID=1149773 RepID=A0A2P7AR19_9HYPH|nr:hypothetical protein CU100_14535 [Phyllobacterium endophyticum]
MGRAELPPIRRAARCLFHADGGVKEIAARTPSLWNDEANGGGCHTVQIVGNNTRSFDTGLRTNEVVEATATSTMAR